MSDTNTNDLLDDVWGDESDSEVQQTTENDNPNSLSQDLKKLREQHHKRGYLDGLVSSKETNLQQGFNEGFPTGAYLGYYIGKIIGLFQILNYKYGDEDSELRKDYRSATKDLKIGNVLSKNIFDEQYNLPEGEEHILLEEWRAKLKKYSNKYGVKFE